MIRRIYFHWVVIGLVTALLSFTNSVFASGTRSPLSSVSLAPTASATHYVFISGDRDYLGPGDTGGRLVDQAALTFRQIDSWAAQDRNNNYVIYFDPRGSGYFFSNHQVRFKIYRRGVRVESRDQFESDSASTATIESFISHGNQVLLNLGPRSFFYYGEHLGGPATRISTDERAGSNLWSIKKKSVLWASQLAEVLGRHGLIWDVVILQTCFMNSLPFLTAVLPSTRQLLIPMGAVSNRAHDWPAFYRNLPQTKSADWGSLLTIAHPTGRWNWVQFGNQDLFHLQNLEQTIATGKQRLEANLENVSGPAAVGHLEEIFSEATLSAGTHEIFVPLKEAADLFSQQTGFSIGEVALPRDQDLLLPLTVH